MKVFKIRDENGLFSTGGTSPSFTHAGKVWNNIGHVKSHLRQFLGGRQLEIYANAKIVCIEYTEKDIENYDILEYMAALNAQDIAECTYPYRKENLKKIRDKIRGMMEDRNE